MGHSTVYKPEAILPFFSAAMDRRVSVALIGDSNMLHAGNAGYAFGLRRSWSLRFPMWGSGVLSGNPRGGYPVDAYTVSSGGAVSDSNDLPATHTQWEPAVVYKSNDWVYGAATYTGTPNTTDNGTVNTMALNGAAQTAPDGVAGSPLNIAGTTVNWHLTYCTFASGGGRFYPCARQPSTGNYFATYDTGVNCQTGVDGLADFTLAIPDDSNGYRVANGLNGFYRRFDGSAISGKVSIRWQQVENPTITSGIATSLNLAQGGLSTRDAVLAYRGAPMAAKQEWFRQLVYLQNGTPMALFHIIQGQNDTAESQLSLGPNPAASNTTAGLVDNHDALMAEISKVWLAQGYDPGNLYFLIGPYHPQGVSRKQWITDADGPSGLPSLANKYSNTAIGFRNERYATTSLFTANSWWEVAPDAHLVNAAAYVGSSELIVHQLVAVPRVLFKGTTGQNLYAVLWQGSMAVDQTNKSLDVPLAANWTRYAATLTESVVGSGNYVATLPVGLPPGNYFVEVRQRAGASPAVSDSAASGTVLTNPLVWDGLTGTPNPGNSTMKSVSPNFLSWPLNWPRYVG